MAAVIDFSEGSDTEDLEPEKIKSRVILITGLTGSGKSSIIKALCSYDDEGREVETKMSFRAVTKNLYTYSNNLITNPKDREDKYAVTLIDTVGLGDNSIDVTTILKQIVENIPKFLSTVHRVVFCFKMDRLRAKMSEELSIMYKFFKMLGAKAENFMICLTFCDILSDETIGSFWEELKLYDDLEMVKEIKSVTFTSFPNLNECDNEESLRTYLERKARVSRRRVFKSIIQTDAKPFYPHDAMTKMPAVDFDVLCGLLRSYNQKRRWYWGLISKTDQEEMIKQLMKWRPQLEKKPKSEQKKPASSTVAKWDRVKQIYK